MKFLKYSVLALALALGSSTFAHAETVAVVDGGILGWLSWLFPPTPDHDKKPNVAPEVDPSLALSGLALLAGTLTVVRARRTNR